MNKAKIFIYPPSYNLRLSKFSADIFLILKYFISCYTNTGNELNLMKYSML